MLFKSVFTAALFTALIPGFLHAQSIVKRDAAIEQMVRQVSADSLKSYINKMVSFGTRNTLSSTTDKNRGIGAACEWEV